MRAVVDPNVLVSAVISPTGPPAAIVRAWTEDEFELVISPQLLDELSEVLSREKFRRWIDADTAAEYVAALAESATTVDDPPFAPETSADPDDDYLIALARAAKADFLVSGDGDLTGLADRDPPVVTPRELLIGSTRVQTRRGRRNKDARWQPAQAIAAEKRMRELLDENRLPQPDRVEYGFTCIRLFFDRTKNVVIVDIDDPEQCRAGLDSLAV